MPVYAGDECYVPACLGALSQQTYANFEVVLASAGANEQRMLDYLASWEGDRRITRLALSAETEEGVAFLTGMLQSQGDAVALLSPRVILAPEALYEYVRCVNSVLSANAQNSKVTELGVGSCDVVYANHDCFDSFEGLHTPSFKPEYSPDLLYSYNYLGPVVFYSRRVISAIQESTGFSSDAFAYDLALKACSLAKHVERIDKMLYHVQDAAPFSQQAVTIAARREEETFRTGRKALANHLRRQGINAVVLADVSERLYRVSYELPAGPSLAVVVIAGKEPELLDSCLSSVEASDLPENTQVVVVECHETDRNSRVFCDHIANRGRAKVVIYEGGANRAAMVNAAVAQTNSDYVLVLEGDGEMVGNQAIASMLAHCMRPDVAVVGAKLLYPDDTVRSAGLMVGPFGVASELGANLPRSASGYAKRYVCSSNVSAVSLSAMMFSRAVYDEVEGFDERFEIHPCEVDFCLKVAKAGKRIAFNGGIEVYRRDADTTGRASLTEDQLLRAEREKAFLHYRWPRPFVKGDPYLSIGLNPHVPYFLLNARS